MAEDANLEEFLKTQRQNGLPCWCVDAPPKIVAQVDAALAEAEKTNNPPQWSAITRWVVRQLGHPIPTRGVQKHRERGHGAG